MNNYSVDSPEQKLQYGYERLHYILDRQYNSFYRAIRMSMNPRKTQLNIYHLGLSIEKQHAMTHDEIENRYLKRALIDLFESNRMFDFMTPDGGNLYKKYTHKQGLVGPNFAERIIEKMDLYRLFIKNDI